MARRQRQMCIRDSMTDRSNQTGTIASVYKVDVPLLVQKLAGQGDMLEGIYNEFND